MTIIRVALDVPVDKLFDYRAPGSSAADIGRRVVVPFGRKSAVGVIVETADASEVPAERLKSAHEVLRDLPLTESTVERLIDEVRCDAEARGLIPIDRQRQRASARLLIARDAGQLRQRLQLL